MHHQEPPGALYMAPGQVFIHEMTHAWQIRTESFVPGIVCRAAFGPRSYTPSLGTPWGELGLEQQATTVDQWFGRHAGTWRTLDELAAHLRSPAAVQDPAFPYIANHIRLGLN